MDDAQIVFAVASSVTNYEQVIDALQKRTTFDFAVRFDNNSIVYWLAAEEGRSDFPFTCVVFDLLAELRPCNNGVTIRDAISHDPGTLWCAIDAGNTDLAIRLIRHGADVNGRGVLRAACEQVQRGETFLLLWEMNRHDEWDLAGLDRSLPSFLLPDWQRRLAERREQVLRFLPIDGLAQIVVGFLR